jgi:hypothetical protein
MRELHHEMVRRMADAEGKTLKDMLNLCVEREWARQTVGTGLRLVPMPLPPPVYEVPPCLEFGEDYRASLGELRMALKGSLAGTDLGLALRERGCRRTTVRRGISVSPGWRGVRVVPT